MDKRTLSSHYRLPRPIPGVLSETRKLIENGTLADVGIPCEGDQIVRLVGAYTQTNQTLRAMLRTGDTGASCDSWHQSATSTRDSTLSMRIQAA